MALKGVVAVSQRDGLGHVPPIVRQGRDHFIGEVGSLPSKLSLLDTVARENAEVPLLLVASACMAAFPHAGESLAGKDSSPASSTASRGVMRLPLWR